MGFMGQGPFTHSAAAGADTGCSCFSTHERSGSSQNAHTPAPTISNAAATTNGACQLPYWARTPNTNGDIAPPKLPAIFIIPDTVPEYLPPVSMGTAQDGPIVHSRKNMAPVRHHTAVYGSSVSAAGTMNTAQ